MNMCSDVCTVAPLVVCTFSHMADRGGAGSLTLRPESDIAFTQLSSELYLYSFYVTYMHAESIID